MFRKMLAEIDAVNLDERCLLDDDYPLFDEKDGWTQIGLLSGDLLRNRILLDHTVSEHDKLVNSVRAKGLEHMTKHHAGDSDHDSAECEAFQADMKSEMDLLEQLGQKARVLKNIFDSEIFEAFPDSKELELGIFKGGIVAGRKELQESHLGGTLFELLLRAAVG